MRQLLSGPDLYIGCSPYGRIAQKHHMLKHTPKPMHGLRILFISDLHCTGRQDAERAGELLRGIEAELLLIGGDLADRREEAYLLLEQLRGLSPRYGCFAVPGNNDAEAFGSIGRLRRALSKAGIELLADETRVLEVNGARLAIGGVNEYDHHTPRPDRLFREPADLRICLSHYPIALGLPRERQPALLLCGHTHGGQFDLLGITPYTIGFERLKKQLPPQPFVSGLHRLGETEVLVSKGIGTSRIPLRIGVRPELHLIELC